MNIIWLTLEPILPANTGGRIGVFKRLERISEQNNIYIFIPYDDEDDLKYQKELLKYCKEVHYYKRKRNIKTILNCIRYPYTIASRNIKSLKIDVEECITNNNIDVINVDFPHMAVNLFEISKKYNIPIVLNEHNIEWQFYQAVSKGSSNILKKLAYFIDSFRLKSYEERLVRKIKFELITFVSIKDMDFYRQWIGLSEKLCLIPVGADLPEKFCHPDNKCKKIVFVGKMSAGPNEDGAVWFIENILPDIVEVYPNLRFYVVGKNPSTNLLKLQNKNIVVTGTVESIDKYYYDANLVVLPLRFGGGVKVKLLEAISFKCPIVTTDIGVEGTELKDSTHLKICNNASQFLKACLDVLADDNITYRENLTFDYFKENLTWEKIGVKYNNLLLKVAKKYNNESCK